MNYPPQMLRQLNALTRTEGQRNKIQTDLIENNGANLDERHAHFQLNRDMQLVYQVPDGDQLIVVMTDEQKKMILEQEINKPENQSKGIGNLYYTIKNKYLNITRKDVEQALKSDPTYAITQKTKPRVNKSVVSSVLEKNALWAVDLIEMNDQFDDENTYMVRRGRNAQTRVLYRYIFSCMDVFSRKIWLEALPFKKTGTDTKPALERIIARNNGVKPRAILCDNGKEFMGSFKHFCDENEIKIRNTRTYSPQANPVERSNREIRETMRVLLTKKRSLKWNNELTNIENSRNSSYHSAIKATPNEVYDDTKDNDAIIERNRKVAREKQAKFKTTLFNLGDRVFCSTEAIYSDARSKAKAGIGKEIIIKYVPVVWVVSKIIRPSQSVVERHRYELQTAKPPYRTLMNQNLSKNTLTPARIYASDLVHCTIEGNDLNLTPAQAIRMNGLKKKRGTDLVW